MQNAPENARKYRENSTKILRNSISLRHLYENSTKTFRTKNATKTFRKLCENTARTLREHSGLEQAVLVPSGITVVDYLRRS